MESGLLSFLTCWSIVTAPVIILPYKKDQTKVSKHLKVLVEAGILKYERQGRNIIYSIKNKEIRDLLVSLWIRDVKPCCDGRQISGVCCEEIENKLQDKKGESEK